MFQRIAYAGLYAVLVGLACLTAGCTQTRTADGLRYFEQGRYDQAVISFQSALAAEPNNPDSYYNMAATYHQSAVISGKTGQIAVAQQQYDEAEKYYRLALSKNPNHTSSYRGLAVQYMERQQPDAAFNLLIGWVQSNPTSSDAKIELARLYQEWSQVCLTMGRSEDAASCQDMTAKMLQQTLLADPANFRALRAQGYLKEQSGDIVGAISDYRLSVQSNPNQQDLTDRINALQQGAGYSQPVSGAVLPVTIPTTGTTTAGATIYSSPAPSPSSTSNALASPYGRKPF